MQSIKKRIDDQIPMITKVFCITTCIMVWMFVLGGWTYTYDTDTPLGSDAPSVIDDRIREVKDSIQERMNIDHYWPLTGSEVSDADAGKHRQVTYRESRDTPTTIDANEGMTYLKDDELHWIDEDENELQLTSAGYIPGDSIAADSIDEGEIQLANNSYLVAANAAGDGEVSLIKADANDVAVLPDGAEMASDAAPDANEGIANKKYVDDQIATALPDDDAFGTWDHTNSKATNYTAASDGFVTAHGLDMTITGKTDSAATPTTVVAKMRNRISGADAFICFPVKKGHKWRVETDQGTPTIHWLPIGG